VSNRFRQRTRPSFTSVARNGGSALKCASVAVRGTGMATPSYSFALHGCGRYCSGALSWAWAAKNDSDRQNGLSFGRSARNATASRSFLAVTWIFGPAPSGIQWTPS
jgi:hypothetical protein